MTSMLGAIAQGPGFFSSIAVFLAQVLLLSLHWTFCTVQQGRLVQLQTAESLLYFSPTTTTKHSFNFRQAGAINVKELWPLGAWGC